MRERDLYIPVRDWLIAEGWTIHVEIFDADIVAVKDGKLLAVELKRGMRTGLERQAKQRADWADLVMIAVPESTYKPAWWIKHHGFGVLTVGPGLRRPVRQRAAPKQQPWRWVRRREYRLRKLAARPPAQAHEVAGLPSCRELAEQRRLREKS
jgi:hypothetical protein